MRSRDELYHYGVKGMKWGVRRTAAQLGHVVRKAANGVKNAAVRYADRHRPASTMSDDELRKRLERIRLEMQYKQAIESLNPKKRSAVSKVISEFGNNTVNSISRKVTDKIVKAMFPDPKIEKKKIDVSKLEDIDVNDPEAVSAANKHIATLNNLMKNTKAYKKDYSNADQDYKSRVERGEGEIQEALKRMGDMSYDDLYKNRNTWYNP